MKINPDFKFLPSRVQRAASECWYWGCVDSFMLVCFGWTDNPSPGNVLRVTTQRKTSGTDNSDNSTQFDAVMYLDQIDALMEEEMVLEAGELDGDDGSDTDSARNEIHIVFKANDYMYK